MKLNELRALGFDKSYHVPFTASFKAICSQCETLVINGYPTHETRCTNIVHECAGCNALVPVRYKYCEDCA